MNKVTKIFFLSSLFFLSCFSNSDIYTYIEKNKLYTDSYWLKLLHYKNNKSEIDSNNFFISKHGKYDLKEELLETIDSLLTGKNNAICRFPLRTLWLKEKIPNLKEKIINYECKELDKYLKEINPKYATLIFPASHINSPASMYGHTFLRIGANNETPLISNAINYAAKTNETNGFIFAYKGLFGGYEGRYSILPYYEKIKEYSNLEQRDIWEYDLNFTEEEVKRMALHAYELQNSFSYYYFFLENCSYNLLWFFEIARSDLELVKNFNIQAAPLDTIKVLLPYGIIKDSKFRYSKMSKMKSILDKISNKKYLKKYLKINQNLEKDLSFDDKVNYLDFKVEYLQYLRSKNKITKKEYLKNYLKLLKERSSFDKISTFNIKKPINPLFSHESSKISLSYQTNDELIFSFKPVYNDIYDVLDGYLDGAYIDFLKIDILKNKNKIFLDKVSILDIESYAKRDIIFKPISWGIEVAYERFKSEEDYFKLKPQFGLTYGKDKEFLYLVTRTNTYIKANDFLVSIGPKIGLVSNRFNNLKIGTSYSYDKYNKSIENKIFELFGTYKVSKNIAFNIKYLNDDLKEKRDLAQFSLFYYF